MTQAEAHELALMHVQFAHELGESALRQGEFWVSVSYGLLVLTFVAPHALNKVTTPLVLTLYILYTAFITTNSYFDLDAAEASRADAGRLVSEHQLNLNVLEEKNRELASFLESIRYSEFTRSFQISDTGSSFDELSQAFNDVMSDFQQVRSEREEHFHYLQSIVQNIDVSILAYQRDGTVEMINPAAKKLFQVNTLKNIHKLRPLSEQLANTLLNMNPGENKLVKVQDEDDILQLAIYATEFKVKDKVILLSTIKNIQNVLEEQETAAWQKLIRVLNHEIMNSITPVTSLAETAKDVVDDISGKTGPDHPLAEELRIVRSQAEVSTLEQALAEDSVLSIQATPFASVPPDTPVVDAVRMLWLMVRVEPPESATPPPSEAALPSALAEQIASQLIEAQRPAFASYRLDIV